MTNYQTILSGHLRSQNHTSLKSCHSHLRSGTSTKHILDRCFHQGRTHTAILLVLILLRSWLLRTEPNLNSCNPHWLFVYGNFRAFYPYIENQSLHSVDQLMQHGLTIQMQRRTCFLKQNAKYLQKQINNHKSRKTQAEESHPQDLHLQHSRNPLPQHSQYRRYSH